MTQRHLILDLAQQSKLLTARRQRNILLVLFSFLLLLVIVFCTFGPSPLLAVALIASLAVAVSGFIQPRLALFLVFTAAGLPRLLVPLPGHTMRLLEPLLFLCLLIILIERPFMRLRLPHRLALLYLAIAVISFIHVPDISTSIYIDGADKRLYTVLLLFIAFFCGTALVEYIKDASSFLAAVLISNIPLYLIGAAQAIGLQVPAFLEASGAQDPQLSQGRLWGPFDGAATFGLYLTNLFAVALACWLLGTHRRDRIIGAVMTIATSLEILGSGTRSAALAISLLVIFALVLTRRFKLLVGSVMLAGAAGVVFFNKIMALFAHPETSTTNRIFLAQEAIRLIASNPWIGIGLTQFRIYYARLITSQAARLNENGISVHNQYLEWAMESGIAWLLVAVALLLSIFFSCWIAYSIAKRRQRILLLAAMLGVLANIVIAFVDVPLDKTEATVFLFLLAGLALGYVERIRWESPHSRQITGSTLDEYRECWFTNPNIEGKSCV